MKRWAAVAVLTLRVCFWWGRIPLCFSTNITKPALGLLPPQITYSTSEATQNECALPPGRMPLPEGAKADTSQSPERHSRDPLCQGICVSLIMTLFQRRSAATPATAVQGFWSPTLLFPLPSLPLHSTLFFLEILIKRKDRDDECEDVPPDDRRRWTACLNLSLI